MSLQNKFYKEILAKKKELEQIRKNGGNASIERDLSCMAVACEYAGVEKCGFRGYREGLRDVAKYGFLLRSGNDFMT